MFRCYCGAVMVSNGTNWVCPFSGQVQVEWTKKDGQDVRKRTRHEGLQIPDRRLTVGRSVQAVRRPMPANFAGHSRFKKNCRVHKGLQVDCQACNPRRES